MALGDIKLSSCRDGVPRRTTGKDMFSSQKQNYLLLAG